MTGIIIQARLASTRLPKKVIIDIEGKTVLEHVIARAKNVKNCGAVVVAIPGDKENDLLEKIAKDSGALVFRGSESDVLDRYYQAAKTFKLDPVVRITADCPLLDCAVAEAVIDLYLKGDYNYASNVHPATFPDGFDVEIFSFAALEESAQKAAMKSQREHVTQYMANNLAPERKANLVCPDGDYSKLRLTLDEKSDLDFIKEICKELYRDDPFFGLDRILALIKEKPRLLEINQGIGRNEGLLKSLKEDEKINIDAEK